MAVTRTGIPIRVWCWPGNQNDQELIRQVKDDLRAWKLSRVVWVADRGFQSEENRRYMQRAGGHYIFGEKLRGNDREANTALARQGRYHEVAENLRVKEVIIDDGTMRDRFVICHNPDEARRDKSVREQLLAQLTDAIAGSDTLTPEQRQKLYGRLSTKRGYKRFIRTTKTGLLRIDRGAVKTEEHLDGKFLLRTSDPTLSVEDIALGYKQLLEIERAWRDMKSTLDLRPVYHRKEERIRAHVLLCWLSLLLIRIAENQAHDTWRNLRDELQRLHLGTFTGPAGTSRQRTELTTHQQQILRQLGVEAPPLFLELAAGHQADTAA
jgi:transposase